jgi:hypothetical protein
MVGFDAFNDVWLLRSLRVTISKDQATVPANRVAVIEVGHAVTGRESTGRAAGLMKLA